MGKPETISSEEMGLRRRARRRLVGAVALVFLAVTVLPLLFSQPPKPLGSDVDIRIPDPTTPFEPPPAVPPSTAPAQQAQTPPEAQPAPAPSQPVTRAPAAGPKPEEGRTSSASEAGKAAEAELPASAAFQAKGYFLQLGAFTNDANARQLAAKARSAGFDVQVQHLKGQVRVKIGPYKERRDALEMQSKLREKGFGPILLGP
jgi:DedD protein